MSEGMMTELDALRAAIIVHCDALDALAGRMLGRDDTRAMGRRLGELADQLRQAARIATT